MAKFDEAGFLLPPDPVTDVEKSQIAAYVRAVYTPLPEKEGLALSDLRPPRSSVSLQRMEQIANALVADGVLRSVTVNGGKGTWAVYHVIGGGA